MQVAMFIRTLFDHEQELANDTRFCHPSVTVITLRELVISEVITLTARRVYKRQKRIQLPKFNKLSSE